MRVSTCMWCMSQNTTIWTNKHCGVQQCTMHINVPLKIIIIKKNGYTGSVTLECLMVDKNKMLSPRDGGHQRVNFLTFCLLIFLCFDLFIHALHFFLFQCSEEGETPAWPQWNVFTAYGCGPETLWRSQCSVLQPQPDLSQMQWVSKSHQCCLKGCRQLSNYKY